MKKKKIMTDIAIFDGQVFQSAAWDRGMGKYSLNFLGSISASKGAYNDIYIILTSNISLPKEANKAIKAVAPSAKLVYLDLKVPKVVPNENIQPIKNNNRLVLEKYIDETFGDAPLDFILLSLFIDQVCSVFPANTNVRKILLFYDLIPLQYSERYSKSWSYPNYLERYDSVFAADRILTISQTVADDLIVYTGIDPAKIRNIDGAPIDRKHQAITKPDINLFKKYILMPSGNELRKNNRRAVEAFEEFRLSTGNKDWQLVLTSYFDTKTKQDLEKLSQNLVFTGNVSEGELRWLYENTESLLFVSEYEGLGLPLLEAIEFDKPVVCSNLKVFNEMSTSAYYYANEHSPSSMAAALERAVNGVNFAEKKAEFPDILKEYRWENTANKALSFLSIPLEQEGSKEGKKKIAVLAPSSTGYSAIGKVVMLLNAALSNYFEIDYYVERARSNNPFKRTSYLPNVASVKDASRFTAKDYAKYDAVIYHIGNSEYHLETIKNALHLPGYMIVHDTKLKEVFEDELYKHAYIEKGRLMAEKKLNELNRSSKVIYMSSLVNTSLGIVTHSEYAKKALALVVGKAKPIKKINLPVGSPSFEKKKLDDRFNVGFGGIIHKAKGLNLVENIISMPDNHDMDLYIFGVPMAAPGEIERLEAIGNIRIEKNLSDFEFENRLADMDVIVSYRPSYNGETSLTVLEAMRHGVVPIVRKVGWFDEIPDECVEKVADENEVVEAVKKLKNNPEYLSAKKQAAKAYTESTHNYKQYAESLYDLIALHGSSTESDNLNQKVSRALREGSSKEDISNLLSNIEQ